MLITPIAYVIAFTPAGEFAALCVAGHVASAFSTNKQARKDKCILTWCYFYIALFYDFLDFNKHFFGYERFAEPFTPAVFAYIYRVSQHTFHSVRVQVYAVSLYHSRARGALRLVNIVVLKQIYRYL